MLRRRKFAAYIIILNPLIDMLFNLLNDIMEIGISINQAIRVVLLIYAMLCLREWKTKRNCAIFALWLIACLFIQSLYGMTFNILTDFGFILKIFSGYVYYRLYYEIFRENHNDGTAYFRAMFISSLIIVANIFLAVFGIGARTYSGSVDRMSGYIGFLSGNCITAICLMILFIVNIVQCIDKRSGILKLFLIINFVALLLLATKFSVIGSLMIVIAIFVYEVYAAKGVKKKRLIIIGGGIGAAVLIAMIPYLINYISGIVQMGSKYGYDFFDTLTSNRGMQIDLVIENYIVRLEGIEAKIAILFGAGYSKVNTILNTAKPEFEVIEWDFHGIYYYLGIGTLLLIIFFLCNCVRKGIYFIKRKNRILSYFAICVFVAIIHGLLGGHVCYESMTLQYFVVIAAYVSAAYDGRRNERNIYVVGRVQTRMSSVKI